MNPFLLSSGRGSRRAWLSAAALMAMIGGMPAWAQTDFPNKPITIVVPFPPAGSTDVMGRQIGRAHV